LSCLAIAHPAASRRILGGALWRRVADGRPTSAGWSIGQMPYPTLVAPPRCLPGKRLIRRGNRRFSPR
jgi:hypothetical protein